MPGIIHFECSKCGTRLDAGELQSACPKDHGLLFARYDLEAARRTFTPASVAAGRNPTLWRYAEVLPQATPVSLGEGFTPLLATNQSPNVYIKDEGRNPTGSIAARALSVIVSVAKAFHARKLAIASNGIGAVTLSAYAARAGMESIVFMPADVPQSIAMECKSYGAHLMLISGTLQDCAQALANRKTQEGRLDVAELHASFGIEGAKTLGYELAEQLAWRLPRAIIYPGDGMGLIAIWKAFAEMEELGWIGRERPRMFSVNEAGAPQGRSDTLVEDILNKSGGAIEPASGEEMTAAVEIWARSEGILAAPEGAASLAAYQTLRGKGVLGEDESVVLINTACGLRQLNEVAGNRKHWPTSDRVGGIIGPY